MASYPLAFQNSTHGDLGGGGGSVTLGGSWLSSHKDGTGGNGAVAALPSPLAEPDPRDELLGTPLWVLCSSTSPSGAAWVGVSHPQDAPA